VNFQAKLFSWQDQGNHLIILARGAIDWPAFRRLFGEIETATQHLSECKVLVDLSDSTCRVEAPEIDVFVSGLPLDRWPRGNKVAFVSGLDLSDFHRLCFLRIALVGRGLTMGVFRDFKVAIDWLAGPV
jgi:hypothetical protein